MARGKLVDKALVDWIMQTKRINPELTTEQIGKMCQRDASTVQRVLKGGSWEGYCEVIRQKGEKRKKQAEEKQKVMLVYDPSIAEEYRREQEAKRAAEEQVPGQIEMELTPAEKPEMSDQVKMMRFQAEMTAKITKAVEVSTVELLTKLDKLNDTMSMILRAIRRE